MFSKLLCSLKNINYRVYFSLIILGLFPTLYTTLRIFFLGNLPGEWTFSIAGQLSWVNLIYEVLSEAIILPLFFFMGSVKDDKDAFSNRIRTGIIISAIIYVGISAFITAFTEPLLELMAADTSIIAESTEYIRIESIANIFSILTQFATVALITLNKSRYIYSFTLARFTLCLICDTFLVSSLPFSAKLGINGIGISNIFTNLFLFILAIYLLRKEGIKVFRRGRPDFRWAGDFFRIGGISGLESLVRNLSYMVMISRMVNIVGEQGTYWVANNFIWGWLLLPILQLGELIKQEVAKDKDNIRKNSLGYFGITFIISCLWFTSIPLWKPFMVHILNYDNAEKLQNLVILLTCFYVLYAFQNVFDSTFYGLGKTKYMLFESVITNVIYYGASFILYLSGAWVPTLMGIALLFGFGNLFDSIVSFFAYRHLLKKEKINIFEVG